MNPSLTRCFALQMAAGTVEHPEEGCCFPRKGCVAGEEDFGLQPRAAELTLLIWHQAFHISSRQSRSWCHLLKGCYKAEPRNLTAPKRKAEDGVSVVTDMEAGTSQHSRTRAWPAHFRGLGKGEPELLQTTGWLWRKLAKEPFRFKLQKLNWATRGKFLFCTLATKAKCRWSTSIQWRVAQGKKCSSSGSDVHKSSETGSPPEFYELSIMRATSLSWTGSTGNRIIQKLLLFWSNL